MLLDVALILALISTNKLHNRPDMQGCSVGGTDMTEIVASTELKINESD